MDTYTGYCQDVQLLFAHVEETYGPGLAAYAEAGIENPREEIIMTEVHGYLSITERVVMEDLQFSQRGKAGTEKGTFFLRGPGSG